MIVYAQDRIWEHFQNGSEATFGAATGRLDYLVRRIRNLDGQGPLNVLNIGTGDGYLEKRVKAQGWESYALDPNPAAIERLAQEGIQGRVGRIEQIPFADGMFDVVVVSEVLEHISENQLPEALREIERVLARGGHLVGTVPYRERLEDWRVVCPSCGDIFHRWGHQSSFDERSMSRRISELFEIEALGPKYLPPWRRLNWKGTLTAILKWSLANLGVHGSGENLFFLAKKV